MTDRENPKDRVGLRKWRQLANIPAQVLWEVGVAFLEGALKYGPYNFRETDIKASVYYDAALGHIQAYWEGEEIDPDSGLPHITKAIASLIVLRDSQMTGRHIDDRPDPIKDIDQIRDQLGKVVFDLYRKYGD